MLGKIFKTLSYFTLMMSGRNHASGSIFAETNNAPDYDHPNSRELLTISPTSSPLPAYMINNGYSSGANSFPNASSYVNSIRGAHYVTFGAGADDQTSTLQSNINFNSSIGFDLDGLGSAGSFAVSGGNSVSYYAHGYGLKYIGSAPVNLTFSSSLGGSFTFNSSGIYCSGAPNMTINVEGRGTTLAFSSGGSISPYMNSGLGNLNINMARDTNAVLSGVSYILPNNGNLNINMAQNTSLAVSDASWLVASPGNVNINTAQNVALSFVGNGYLFTNQPRNVTIHDGSLFYANAGFSFYQLNIIIATNSTFTSGSVYLNGGCVTFLPYTTHLVELAAGSMHLDGYGADYACVMLNNATLNVVITQGLSSFYGQTIPIIQSADPKNMVFGKYDIKQLNGVAGNLPFQVIYTSNSVSLVFFNVTTPAPSLEPSKAPSKQPSKAPSKQPSLVPSIEPSKAPSGSPTTEVSAEPSLLPTPSPQAISSTYSACKMLPAVVKRDCHDIFWNITYKYPAKGYFGGLFPGTSIKDCIVKFNCTVIPVLTNLSETHCDDDAKYTPPSSAPPFFIPPLIPSTSNSLSEGYVCREHSDVKCDIVYMTMDPEPGNLSIGSSYILKGNSTMNCSSVYVCLLNPNPCTGNSSSNNSARALLQTAPREEEEEEALDHATQMESQESSNHSDHSSSMLGVDDDIQL